jgi:hypothetical protein
VDSSPPGEEIIHQLLSPCCSSCSSNFKSVFLPCL